MLSEINEHQDQSGMRIRKEPIWKICLTFLSLDLVAQLVFELVPPDLYCYTILLLLLYYPPMKRRRGKYMEGMVDVEQCTIHSGTH
jgi:hypothetical protein